jgi:hypothetical protein
MTDPRDPGEAKVDVDDARFCPIHGGDGCTNV